MTIQQADFHAFSLVRLSDSLGAYNISSSLDTQNLLEQIQTTTGEVSSLRSQGRIQDFKRGGGGGF